jgi:mono/diheme cytochrome c family protein
MKKVTIIVIAIAALISCSKKMTPSSANVTQASSRSTVATNVPREEGSKKGGKNILAEVATEPPKPSAPGAAEVVANPRETEQTLAGKSVYKAKCGQCHDFKDPQAYDAARWAKIIDWMAPRAKLDAVQKENVLAYVSLYARR